MAQDCSPAFSDPTRKDHDELYIIDNDSLNIPNELPSYITIDTFNTILSAQLQWLQNNQLSELAMCRVRSNHLWSRNSITHTSSLNLSQRTPFYPTSGLQPIIFHRPHYISRQLTNLFTNAEHYLAPLHLALRSAAANALPFKLALTPFPSGTGHMITSLRSGEIDIAIGLTEGWVAGLAGKQAPTDESERGYKVVGHWADTPLRWAIVTGRKRDELTDVKGLEGGRVGVSRLGR